ncbi:MAG: cache domain-containing protein, partial [Methanobacteriota archaeon]
MTKFKFTFIKTSLQRSIQYKIMVLGAVAMLLIAGVIIGYSANALYKEAFTKAEYQVESRALTFGADMNADLTRPLTISETLAKTIQGWFESGNPPTRAQINGILEKNLKDNPEIFGVYVGFESGAFDTNDAVNKNLNGGDETGRFVPYWFRDGTSILMEPLKGMDTDEYYQLPETTKKPAVTEPYSYNAGGKDVMMGSLTAPIIINGTFIGIAGVDLELTGLNQKAETFDMYDNQANLLFLTKGGMVVGENLKDVDWVGKKAIDIPLEN